MSASRFVGRVGGLAFALGVGVAIFSGPGVATADTGGDAESAAPQSARSGATASASESTATGSSRGGRTSRASAVAPAAASATRGVPASSAARTSTVVSTIAAASATAPDSESGDAGADPLAPVTAPLDWAVAAATSRLGAASATANAAVTNGSLTVNPTTVFADGIYLGNLNAVSTNAGATLTYSFVNSSAGGKLDIGTVPGSIEIGGPQSYTLLPYANWLDAGGTKGAQTFTVRVSESTPFDKFLVGIPLVGTLAGPIISLLQQTPLISSLLAPIIGSTVAATININVATDAPGDTPLAFTYKVESFDGTLISTNFFPRAGLAAGGDCNVADQCGYTALNPPGLGGAGATNPYATSSTSASVPGLGVLRNGYNVITWDPRGEFASGGILELDNPFYEGRDVSAIIDWAAADTPAVLDGFNDPAVGMIGGSYGGGIQMSTVDTRLDAIVPGIAWNSLNSSLYPDDIFKTAWANVFGLALLTSGARVNGQVYPALISGNLLGVIDETAQAVLGSSGPTALLNQLQAPTLLVQGIVDALFPLAQSVANAQGILANPYGTPVKMIWFCGGHGVCLDLTVPEQAAAATTYFTYEVAWLDKYVKGVPIPDAYTPTFQWWDQLGDRYTSDLYPFDPDFNQPFPLTSFSEGGQLAILPFAIGGSGPNTDCGTPGGSAACSWPLSWVFATEAPNAVNVDIDNLVTGQQVVGAPTVTFSYSGIGTARAVYGQIVDNATGRVLGNIATPIPVTLDGQTRQVSAQLANIAYTAGTSPSLTLQVVGGATLYLNSAIGLMNISDVQVDLPIRA